MAPLVVLLPHFRFLLARVEVDGFGRGFAPRRILDFYLRYFGLGHWPFKVDVKQAVYNLRAANLDSFGQNEAAGELPGGDAAVQVNPCGIAVFLLPAADNQLIVLDADRKVVIRKTRNGQRDPQAVFASLFDVVRRIALSRGLIDPVQNPLDMVEPQKQRARKN